MIYNLELRGLTYTKGPVGTWGQLQAGCTRSGRVAMAIVDIEPLQDIEEDVRGTAHRFAEEVMRPAGAALDRLDDPAEVIASDSLLWSVFERYQGLGLQAVEEDPALEPATRARIQAIVAEELGWGDSGLA